MENRQLIAIAAFLLILVVAGVLIYTNGKLFTILGFAISPGLPNFAGQIGSNTSVTLLSLQNLNVQSNLGNGFNGQYFLATVLLNQGGQFINATFSSQQAGSALNLQGAQNKQDTIQFKILNQSIIYPVSYSVQSPLVALSFTAYQGTITYNDCSGNPGQQISGYGNFASGCVFGFGQQYQSYFQSCLNANPGSTYPVFTGSWTYSLGGNSNYQAPYYQCWSLTGTRYGVVYPLGNQYVQSTVQAMINGRQLIVSTANPVNDSFAGGSKQAEVRFVNLYQLNGRAINQQNLPQVALFNNGTSYAVLPGASGETTQEQQDYVNIVNQLNQYSINPSSAQATMSTLQTLVNTNNNQLALIVHQANYTLGGKPYTFNQGNGQVIISDTSAYFFAPYLQMIVNATSMGLYLPAPSFAFAGWTQTAVKSGAGQLNISVRNTGSIQGTASVSVTMSGQLTVQNPSVSQNINPGQTQTFIFYISAPTSSTALTSQFTATLSATNNPSNSTQLQGSVSSQPQCPGQQIVNGQCVPLQTITTTVTGYGSSTVSISGGTTTTIAQCIIATISCLYFAGGVVAVIIILLLIFVAVKLAKK